MSDQPPRTAGGIALPTDRPADIVTTPRLPSERPIREFASDVDQLRRIHLLDMALAINGGRKESWRAAESAADLDEAVVKLIDRLRADGLA